MAQHVGGAIRIALTRHAETERRRPGASPGTVLLVSLLESVLGRRVDVVLLPADFYEATTPKAVRLAEELLRAVDVVVMLAPANPAELDALFLVRRASGRRVPVLYFPLGEFPRGAWTYRHVHRFLGGDDVLCFSSSADQRVHRTLVARSATRDRVVPLGIDTGVFAAARTERAGTRRALGVADDDQVVVMHGRIDAEKNVDAVVDLHARLRVRYPRLQLWLIGPSRDGEPAPPWPAPHSATGSGRVRRWGSCHRPEVARLVAAADLGLCLTLNRDENFGFAPVEAMASGLAVVGSDWGGLRDTIVHGVTGFRVDTTITRRGPVLDAAAARRFVSLLLDDDRRRRSMGTAGSDRVAARYSIERLVDTVLDLAREARELTTRPATEVRHRWTAAGERFVQQFSVPVTGPGIGRFPLPIPPDARGSDTPVALQLLGPYATRTDI